MDNAEPQSNSTWKRVYKPNRVWKIFIWVVASSVLIGATVWSVTNTVEFYLGYNPISTVSMQYDDISVCYVEKTRILEDTVPSFAYLSASRNSTTFIKLLQAEHTRLQIITDNFAKKCGTADCWSANYHKLVVQLNSPMMQAGQLQFVWLMARLFNEVKNNFYPTEVMLEPLGNLINDYKNLWQTINNQYPVAHFRDLVDSIICYKMGLSEFSFSIRHDHFHNQTKWNGFVVNNPCSMDNIWWSGVDLNEKETEFICVRTDGQHWLNFSRDTRTSHTLSIRSLTNDRDFLNLSGTTVVELKPKSFVLYKVEEILAMDEFNWFPIWEVEDSDIFSTVALIEHVGNRTQYGPSEQCALTTTNESVSNKGIA